MTYFVAWYWQPYRWRWYFFPPAAMTTRHVDGSATRCTRAGFNLGPLCFRLDWSHRPTQWLGRTTP